MTTTTTLTARDAAQGLKNISIKSIKDIRALDVDLLIVLTNGDRIIVSGGAVAALTTPNLPVEFAEGALTLGGLFQQIDQIQLSPEANLTAASKEITRYNQNNAKVNKTAEKQQEDGDDKLVIAKPGDNDPRASSASHAGTGNTNEPEFPSVKSPDTQKEIASVEINSSKEESWSKVWPIAAGLLALLAGGGSSGGAAAAVPVVEPGTPATAAKVSGFAALGSISDATVTIYGDKGQVLGSSVVQNGAYEVTLTDKGYKGTFIAVITDNNGPAVNYANEGNQKGKDLGTTSLRVVGVANGVDQTFNVTALTELAALKAGLAAGQTSLSGVTETQINNANKAVSNFWGTDILQDEVVPTYVFNVRGQVVANPDFTAKLSLGVQNQAVALQAISALEVVRKQDTNAVLDALSQNLQPLATDPTQLQWQINNKGNTTPAATALQAQLYAETVTDTAQKDQLQNVPKGEYSTVADYLTQNHVAIPAPLLAVKDADPSKPSGFQTIQASQVLILDQDDLTSGNLAVKGPAGATASVTLVGQNVFGAATEVFLGTAVVDKDGLARISVSASTSSEGVNPILDTLRSGNWSSNFSNVTAVINVKDGNNSRTTLAEWSLSNVMVDLKDTPTTLVQSVTLVNDTYQAAGAEDPIAVGSNTDLNTADATVRITLSKALGANEQIQYAIGTGSADNPTWGAWVTPTTATQLSDTSYVLNKITTVNQTMLVKTRVVKTGDAYTGGVGNATAESAPITLTFDNTKPVAAKFVVSGDDDGKSNTDGVLLTANKLLVMPVASAEYGAEIHYQLASAIAGGGSVQLTNAAKVTSTLTAGVWYTLQAGDVLKLVGDTRTDNGKFVINTRQVDLAGNVATATQTYVVDTTGAIEVAVALVKANQAVIDAQSKVDNAASNLSPDEKQLLQDGLAKAKADQLAAIQTASQPLTSSTTGSTLRDVLGNKLAGLGLPLGDDYLKAAINLLATQTDPEVVNNKPALAALVAQAVAKANDALAVTQAYDGTNTAPTLQTFKDLGADGVTDSNLPFIKSALAALPPSLSDSIPEVQATVNAYNKLLALADGRANSADTVLTPAEVASLGITPAITADAAKLLGTAVDTLKPEDISTADQLNALAAAAARITAVAGGQTPSMPLTAADFVALGIAGVNADTLIDVIEALRVLGDSTKADTLKEVTDVVNRVLGALKDIINYADDSTTFVPPSLATYQSKLTAAQINKDNIDAINTAIDALGKTDVDSWNKVKAIVNTYNTILAAADTRSNGGASALIAADYKRLGVTALDTRFPTDGDSKANALTLLNNTVDTAARTGVDSVDELNKLASAAARVVQQAAGQAVDPAITPADLALLGVPASSVNTPAKLAIALAGIKGTADDGSGVTSVSDINGAVAAAQAAQDSIAAYATDPAHASAPDLSAYQALGINGVDTPAQADALNSALATGKVPATTPTQVQAIATAYATILGQAGDTAGTHTDPKPDDYLAIGATVAPTLTANELLNTALALKNDAAVDTLDEVNALINTANAVMALAAGNTSGLTGNTPQAQAADLQAKLAALGVTGLDPTAMAAVQAAIVASNDNGSAVNSLGELQSMADAAKAAQQAVKAFADGGATAPDAATYAAMGIVLPQPPAVTQAVADAMVAALNNALASDNISSSDVSTPQQLQAIANAYAHVLAAADAGVSTTAPAKLPTAADYAALEITPLPAAGSDTQPPSALNLLNSVVDGLPQNKVNTPAALSELSGIVARLMDTAAGNTATPPLSVADLERLGLTGVDANSLPAVLSAIAATANDGTGIDSLSELKTLADNAKRSQDIINQYANSNGALGFLTPGVDDYANVGLVKADGTPLVTAVNKDAINAVLATPGVTSEQVKTPELLGQVVGAYQSVLAAANSDIGSGDTLSPEAAALTESTLTAIGIDLPKTGAGLVSPDVLNNVKATINALASSPVLDVVALQTSVNAIAEISQLADGGTNNDATKAKALDVADLVAAGATVTSATVNPEVVADAVGSALDGLSFNTVNTPAKLQAVVDAYAKILAEANEPEPNVGTNYTNKDNTADRTPSADPLASDYLAIGANLPGITTLLGSGDGVDIENLHLLNDTLKRKAASQVDTISELNALGEAVQTVMAQVALSGGAPITNVTDADKQKWLNTFQTLGVTGLDIGTTDDPGNIVEVLNRLIAQNDDGSTVQSVAQIQSIIDAVNASLKVITDYARGQVLPTDPVPVAPTRNDYANAGIKTAGVALVTDANLTAVNNAVDALTDADVDIRGKIKNVVNAYNAILDFANGTAADSATKPTEAQYKAIGVNLASTSVAVIKDGVTDPRVFSLLTDVIGAQQDAGIDSPAKIEALAQTAGDLVRLAREVSSDAIKAPINLARLQAIGVLTTLDPTAADQSLNDTKVAAFLDAVKRSDDALTGSNKNNGSTVDTLPELLAIANATDKILNYAADLPGVPAPVLADYAAMGITVPVTPPAAAANVLAMLDNAVKAAAPSAVDTVAELNALAAIVDKIMQVAAGVDLSKLTPPQTLSAADLAKVGIAGVNTASDLAAVLGKIASTNDTGADLTSLTALQAMVDNAKAAQLKIKNYAQNDSGEIPLVSDFDAIGLTVPGPATSTHGEATQAQYLEFIQKALASSQIKGVDADTPAEVGAIITAAQHVLDAANGIPNDAPIPPGASSAITRADLVALGLDPAKLTVNGTITLLSGVIDASTADKVNTPALLEGLLNQIAAVMAEAAGTGTKTDDELKAILSQLNAIPTDSSSQPTVDLNGNWPAIREAIKASKNDGSDIDTLTELRDLIQAANDAQDIIRNFADNPNLTPPSAHDYTAIGLVNTAAGGDITPLVTDTNLGAINAALATVGVTGDKAKTPALVKQVVDAYNKILDEANGPSTPDRDTTVNPLAADYTAIGADIDGITKGTPNANALSLLNSVVGNVNDDAVDTPDEINNLGVLVNKVMLQAKANPGEQKITVDELKALGVNNKGADGAEASPGALQAALRVIALSNDNGDAVKTLGQLDTMVQKAINAYNKINTYADADPSVLPLPAAPDATDFAALGLIVPASVTANAGKAIAASLLTPGITSDTIKTPDKLQAILDAYDKVLKAADGTPDNTTTANAATADDLTRVGVVLGSTNNGGLDDVPKLNLLQSALDAQRNADKVDSPAKIEAINTTAAALIDSALNRTPVTVTPQKLMDLGMNLPAGLTQQQADAIASAIAAQGPTGNAAKVDTIAELNAIATKALNAQAKIMAYAADAGTPPTAPAPGLSDYLDLGLVKSDGTPNVTDANLAAVNSALATPSVTSDKADSPQEVKAIVAACDKVLDVATPPTTGSVPAAADYTALGLNPVPADGSTLQTLLNDLLPILGNKAGDLANVQAADVALNKIITAADGSPNGAPALTSNDLKALGLTLPTDPVLASNLADLVSAVVDAKPASGVDTLPEVQAILVAAQKLMNTAAGLPVSPALTAADLATLGLDISGKTPAEQEAILAAIGTSADSGADVNSLSDLTTLINNATIALAKIADYAGIADPVPADHALDSRVPTAADYKNIGVAGVTDANVAPLNAALATAVVGRTEADTQPEVQALANIYGQVLAAADNVRGNTDLASLPSAADLQKLGVNLGSAATGDAFGLLQTALDAVLQTQVDTPAEISDMANSAAKIVAAANGTSTSTSGADLTLADFTRLGVQGLDADRLTAAIDAVVNKASGADVNTAAKLQAVIDGLLHDLKVIKNFADGIVNTDSALGDTGVVLVPTLANYIGTGISGVGDAAGQVPLSTLNAAVDALSSGNVDSRGKLQDVVNAYAHVLAVADGIQGNAATPVSHDELVLIGVSPSKIPAADSPALGLLQGVLDAQPADHSTVNTPQRIGNLADLAAKVVAYAADTAIPPNAPAPTVDDLKALGITGLADNATATALQSAIQLAIAAADATGVDTLAEVQQIVNAAAKVRNLTANANGSAITDPRPDSAELSVSDFKALGVNNAVDAPTNTELLNDAIDSTASYGLVDSPDELKALAALVNKVMDVANDVPGVTLSRNELQKLGLTAAEVTPESLSAAVAAIKAKNPIDVDTVAELRAIAVAARDAQAKITTYAGDKADNSAPTPGETGAPTQADFEAMGVQGVRSAADASKPASLAAVLAALATDGVNSAKTASASLVQGIVDSYNKILGLADGTPDNTTDAAATPVATDYANIGLAAASVTQLSDVSTLKLLNSAVDAQPATRATVDKPSEIQDLLNVVNKVLAYAKGGTIDPTLDELGLLGITGVTTGSLPAVLTKIAQVPDTDVSSIDTIGELQTLADKAKAAQAKIAAYADTNATTPTWVSTCPPHLRSVPQWLLPSLAPPMPRWPARPSTNPRRTRQLKCRPSWTATPKF
jgi:hypothetical protein